MANQTAGYSIGSWEELRSVVFDIGTLEIRLEAEEGYEISVPCDDLMELHRLAQVSIALADGYEVELKWQIPVLSEEAK